jgi:Ser/Thr protein kinase RdoA (MazF antagonist)
MPIATAAKLVLLNFPAATAEPPEFLGHHEGTSGASILRVVGHNGPLCLKAWPAGTSGSRLAFVHRLLHAARMLDFVPQVFTTRYRATWVEQSGRLWDLTTWMPGQADFAANPFTRRLENACTALARLHLAWQSVGGVGSLERCAAVQRRLARVKAWMEFVASGWQPPGNADHFPALAARVVRAWQLLPPLMADLPRQLAPWIDYPAAHQSCHGDVWHDNILFQADAVTGIIDYGNAMQDHVAVDLARLLGSLVPDDSPMVAIGMAAYASVRRLTPAEEKLVGVLDWTGTVIGAANWLLWLYWEKRRVDNLDGAVRRLDTLLTRIERRVGTLRIPLSYPQSLSALP